MSQPDPRLHGRSIPFSMGKVLGGGSSINLMMWARAHPSDWEHFASESGEPAWGYEPVLDLYRQIEDWHGIDEPDHRGRGGPVFVQPAPDVRALATATVEAARAIGIPIHQSPNGRNSTARPGIRPTVRSVSANRAFDCGKLKTWAGQRRPRKCG